MKKMKALLWVLSIFLLVFGITAMPAEAANKKAVQSVSIKKGKTVITKKFITLQKGDTALLTVKVKPAGSQKTVKFSSSNKKIVSVNSKGKIKANKKGTVKITIKVKGKNGKIKKTWVKVKVKNKSGACKKRWANWNDAYKDFVLNKKFLKSGQKYGHDEGDRFDPSVCLYDMDRDGVPELVIDNGHNARATRWAYIYTYMGGKVKYLGIGPTDAFFIPGSEFSGIFGWCNMGAGEATWSYYQKTGKKVHSETICFEYSDFSGSTKYEYEANNKELIKEFRKAKQLIQWVVLSKIREIGWNNFGDRMEENK